MPDEPRSRSLMEPPRDRAESLVDIHRSLPPEIQKHLSENESSRTHHAVLENMRSMDVGQRADYGRSFMPDPYEAHMRSRAKPRE